jgi:hypothetical protein
MLSLANGKTPVNIIAGSVTGFLLGVLFSAISGDLDPASYLLELMSMMFAEPVFIVLFAVFARKYGWQFAIGFAVIGFAGAMIPDFQMKSLTPVIFLKDALMGIILGERFWFGTNFTLRFCAVSIPGIILSIYLGYYLVIHGVGTETLNGIKKDSLDLYNRFMPKDDAQNATDNAILFLKSIFGVGFAVYFLATVNLVWFSFLFSGFLMPKFKEISETVPRLTEFRLPFHVVWIFIASAALWLLNFEPLVPLSINILAAMAGLYAIQGLAVVLFHFNGISMGRLPRIVFWVIFFLTLGFTAAVMLFIGLLDNWFNMRIINNDKMSNEG